MTEALPIHAGRLAYPGPSALHLLLNQVLFAAITLACDNLRSCLIKLLNIHSSIINTS